jgi:Predicted secreted (periplasmic) protein
MIRGLGTTIACACLAGAMGVGLFFVKHEVKEQEARLAELNQEIQSNQEAIHVLKAEWSYLNDPARLRALSEKFLSMKVMGPAQIASLETLPAAAPVAVARASAPAVAAPVTMAAAKPSALAPVTMAAAKPLAPAPVTMAAAKPLAPAPSPAPAAKPAQIPAKAPTAVAKASAPIKQDAKPAAVAAAKAPTATVAAARPALVPGADTTPRMAAAPVAAPQPGAPQTRPPGQPGRTVVVQSPALASTPLPPGEVR